MSNPALTWAYEQTVKPTARKFVLIAIADYADQDGYTFPSQQTIADMTDQGVSTVREHLRELEKQGLITREHRHRSNGSRTSDRIRLNAPPDRLVPKPKTKKTQPPDLSGSTEQHRDTPSTKRPAVTGEKNQPPDLSEPTARFDPSLPPDLGYPDPSGDPSVDPPGIKINTAAAEPKRPAATNTEPEPPYKSAEFLEALNDWEQHRKEISQPIKPTGRKKLYKQLATLGEQRSIAAIDYSIAKNYRGVFEPFEQNGNRPQPLGRPTKVDGSIAAGQRVIAELEAKIAARDKPGK